MTSSPTARGDHGALPALLADSRRTMLLHAHPDDESLSTGGTIALLVAQGTRVTVLTGTRGERGEVVEGPLKEFEGTPRLAALREHELAAAMGALGVTDHIFLGTAPARASGRNQRIYTDSGMIWGAPGVAVAAPDAGSDALSVASLDEVSSDIEAALRAVAPDLVITYNSTGGYGHPDHVRMHDAGRLAARAAGIPLLQIEPEGSSANGPVGDLMHIDICPWLDTKIAALASHQSQLTVLDGGYRLSGGQTHRLDRTESFRVLQS
jgi:LmbE family N-acetylglucosaminyl deacetylase